MKKDVKESKTQQISLRRINWIREQGYMDKTNEEIEALAYGNRFAYRVCVSLLLTGVVLGNIPMLSIMLLIAFLGVVLPNHPFDYIYNYVLTKKMNKPVLPPRSNQLKFACTVATIWIAGTIYLFYSGLTIWGYVAGGSLVMVAALVSVVDFCIPSKIYNALFIRKSRTNEIGA